MANAHDLLMAQRAAMMGSPLPYDAEVEYLESTGTQYIDTGIIPDNTTGMRLLASFKSFSDVFFCGCRQNSSDTRFTLGNNGKKFNYGWGKAELIGTEDSSVKNVKTDLSNNFYNARMATVENTSGYNESSLSFELRLPFIQYGIILFGRNTGGSIISNAFVCYEFQITRGDILILDFIPVRFTNEIGDSEGAMYDRVSGRLFRNIGTGAFVIGPDKT